MVKVKICGITNAEDALKAVECGADYLGFVFVSNTPRAVDIETAKEVSEAVGERAQKVGLFTDEEAGKVMEIVTACGLDHVQLHGHENPGYCRQLKELFGRHGVEAGVIKAFRVSDKILGPPLEEYICADNFVFDTFQPGVPGGTGAKFNWDVLNEVKDFILKPFFIAGGLNPQNGYDAVKAVDPFGVDVASGVESAPGKKDEGLLKEYIENAKKEEITEQ